MTLATLFLCGKEHLITSFFSKSTPSFCDGKLPLQLSSPEEHDLKLSKEDRELFVYSQWQVYTPFLTGIVSKDEVETFPDEISLPWEEKSRIPEKEEAKVPDEEELEVSFVEKVQIHSGNHDLTQNHETMFALKTFKPRILDN